MDFDIIKARIRTFIEGEPLYRKLMFEELFKGSYEEAKSEAPTGFKTILPSKIALDCPICKSHKTYVRPQSTSLGIPPTPTGIGSSRRIPDYKETTTSSAAPPLIETGIEEVHRRCVECNEDRFLCWVEINSEGSWIRKVGQLPPWSLSTPKDLEETLGEDARLYNNVRTFISQSYGIGACSYMRRLLENQVAPLLNLVHDIGKENGTLSESEMGDIQATIQGRAFEEKAEVLYNNAPESVIVPGDNPIKLLHERLSDGLHNRNESECTEVAKTGLRSLEHLIRSLSQERSILNARKELERDTRELRSMYDDS